MTHFPEVSSDRVAALEATVVHLMAPHRIELRREPVAPDGLAPHQLLCETLATAISPGTELAAYAGLPPLRAGVAYPRLQGYCNVARVLAAGSAVQGFAVGDRVLSFTSHRSHFVLDADEVLLRLPAEAKTDEVVCSYLFHLGYNAVLRADVRAGSRVLVIGLGALGLTTVAMARLAGAEVVALSNQPRSTALALRLGASAVHNRSSLAELKQALGDGLADVVVTTTNGWDDWAIALQMAGTRGTIASLGFPGRGQAPGTFNPLDSQYFYAKQLRIESVGLSPERPDSRGFLRFNERSNLRYIAERIVAGQLDTSALVSGRYAGTDIKRAYEDLLARRDAPITYLLTWKND
jgi:threonine dehydrogenase-like Zn-dependent dehydrogenase